VVQALGTATAATGIAILAIAWWRSPLWSAASRDLLLAATLSGSLVLNVYTPIYDTNVTCAAVALAAGALLKGGDADRDALQAWLLLLYMVPWLTQSFADFLHFQPLTLVLTGFAYWALTLAWRESRLRPADEARIPALVTPLAVTE
jgi:hypothetical protein